MLTVAGGGIRTLLCVCAAEHGIANSIPVVRMLNFIDSFTAEVTWTPTLYMHILHLVEN
jgi:hypothetical protein